MKICAIKTQNFDMGNEFEKIFQYAENSVSGLNNRRENDSRGGAHRGPELNSATERSSGIYQNSVN